MPTPTILALATLARAGAPKEDLARLAHQAPDVALGCASAREAWPAFLDGVRALARASVNPAAAPVDLPDLTPFFDAGSRLTVALRTETPWFELAFTTSAGAERVARAMAGLDPQGPQTVTALVDGWRVGSGVDPLEVRGSGDWVRLATGHPPETDAGPLPAGLLDALPDDRGCVVLVRPPMGDDGTERVHVAAHLALRADAPIPFAVAGEAARGLVGIAPAPGPVPDLRTRRTPSAVVVVGLGLDGINFSRFLEGDALRQARRLQAALPITAGSVVAAFGERGRGTLHLAAMLPFPDRYTGPALARRVQRVLRPESASIRRLDRTHFVAEVRGRILHFAAERGRLYVSDEADLVVDVALRNGAPWVHPEVAALAERYPVVVSVLPELIPGVEGDDDRPLSLALGLDGAVLRGEVWMPLPLDTVVMLLQRAMAPPR